MSGELRRVACACADARRQAETNGKLDGARHVDIGRDARVGGRESAQQHPTQLARQLDGRWAKAEGAQVPITSAKRTDAPAAMPTGASIQLAERVSRASALVPRTLSGRAARPPAAAPRRRRARAPP